MPTPQSDDITSMSLGLVVLEEKLLTPQSDDIKNNFHIHVFY